MIAFLGKSAHKDAGGWRLAYRIDGRFGGLRGVDLTMCRMQRFVTSLCLCTLTCLPSAAKAENWSQWRGPTADGVAGSKARPPLKWDARTNLAWAVDLPGEGSATPIIFGNQLFVLSAEQTSKKSSAAVVNDERAKTIADEFFYRFVVTSFDRYSGKMRWQKIATEQVPHEGRHQTNTYAAGSPTTDGERLYVSFGSRGLFCYSLEGELIWQIDLGKMRTRFGWGEALTPVLADDHLILNWDQEEGSFIIAVNKRTGQTVWKVDRPGEVTSWNTPLVTPYEGKQLVIVNGTQSVKAYDAKNGNLVWECGGQTTNAIPSPIRFEDTAICMSGYRGACACAIPLNSVGDVTNSPSVRWKVNQGTPYVPSPIISGNRLFFTAGNTDVMSCIDVRTGKSLMDRKRLSGVVSLYASPLLANGYLYFTGREGTTVVVKDNENLDVVAVNAIDDVIDASPVAVDDQLFLRSWKKLYCFQDKRSAENPISRTEVSRSPETLASFKQVLLEPSSETSANASVGDLDGDGDLDVVLAKGRHWPLHNQILLNNGQGEFPNHRALGDLPDRTYSAALADLDGDGDLDILVSNDSPDKKMVYLNDGKASFKDAGTWGESFWNTRNTCLADLNGDHFPDLIAANRRSPSYLCINDGRGSFSQDRRIEIPSESATTIVPGDFNKDGFIDLAIPHRDGGSSRVYANDGKLGFKATNTFGPAKSAARACATGDLNGDGWLDLVVGDERQGALVCLNDRTGAFPNMIPVGDRSRVPYSIAIGDLNQDTKADIVIGYASGPSSVLYNGGAGTMYEPMRMGDGKGAVYGIALGDLNRDGKIDIVVGRSDAPNAIYLNQGTW
jgi:outer membrane protein assembly factor BamB